MPPAPQNQREQTLAGFRGDQFSVLVATDVAARGLDINGVELVLQIEPPKEPETYIHRSGTRESCMRCRIMPGGYSVFATFCFVRQCLRCSWCRQ